MLLSEYRHLLFRSRIRVVEKNAPYLLPCFSSSQWGYTFWHWMLSRRYKCPGLLWDELKKGYASLYTVFPQKDAQMDQWGDTFWHWMPSRTYKCPDLLNVSKSQKQKKVFCKSKHWWLCPQKIYKLRQTKLSQFVYFSLVLRAGMRGDKNQIFRT